MQPLKVTISVYGRFHAFDLARELERQGALQRLISSYPKGIVKRFGVAPEKVVSLLALEAYGRAARRLPAGLASALEPLGHAAFERAAACALPQSMDVFVGWSGSSLKTLEAARERGAKTIIERGSAHILAQQELLLCAYAEARQKPQLPPPSIVERELAEYAAADRIAVPSEFAARTFVERGIPRERLLVNPYGVDLEAFTPADALPEGLRLLFVGRASIQKGAHHLLEAFHRIRDPNARLTFVGPVEPELEAWFARYGDARVVRIGAIPQADLPPHYRAANLFCLPSHQDGLGMVLFQAAASGLPLITTPNTGGSSLLEGQRCGWRVAVGSVPALREAIEEARDLGPGLADFGRAARAKVASGLSWKDYGQRALRAYEALCCSPQRAAA